jgi:hypothetical protein
MQAVGQRVMPRLSNITVILQKKFCAESFNEVLPNDFNSVQTCHQPALAPGS